MHSAGSLGATDTLPAKDGSYYDSRKSAFEDTSTAMSTAVLANGTGGQPISAQQQAASPYSPASGGQQQQQRETTSPHPNFTGWWRCVKQENFDEYLKALGLPWVVRKAARKFGRGSTDVIWQKGRQMRATTVNAKGAWTRMYTEGKDIYQKNAAGEPVQIRTWWEGKVHKCRAVGSSFGQLESWRYMEGSLMVVRSRVTAPDSTEGDMYWYFEALPVPHRNRCNSSGGASSGSGPGGGAPSKATLKQVWRDQSLVEKATRADNLHLQVLLHDLSRWETPADRFIQLNVAYSGDERSAAAATAGGGATCRSTVRSPRSSKPVSPASSVRSMRSRAGVQQQLQYQQQQQRVAPCSIIAALPLPGVLPPNGGSAAAAAAVAAAAAAQGLPSPPMSSATDLAALDSFAAPSDSLPSLPPSASATTPLPGGALPCGMQQAGGSSTAAAAAAAEGAGMRHRRVLSDPSSVLSGDAPTTSYGGDDLASDVGPADDTAAVAVSPARASSDGRPPRPPTREDSGLQSAFDPVSSYGSTAGQLLPCSSSRTGLAAVGSDAGALAAGRPTSCSTAPTSLAALPGGGSSYTAALTGASSAAALSEEPGEAGGVTGSGVEAPPSQPLTPVAAGGTGGGVESPPAVESPRSIKSADALSGRSVPLSGRSVIRATPRCTPAVSMDENDLEKLLAWKIHEFKDIRGIASVVPVADMHTTEPELLQMSPEQAEQTHVKLQELEAQAKLQRQVMAHSFACLCCMLSCHEFQVPDYLKSWEM